MNELVWSLICPLVLKPGIDHLFRATPCAGHWEQEGEGPLRCLWSQTGNVITVRANWSKMQGMVTSTWKFRGSLFDRNCGSAHGK